MKNIWYLLKRAGHEWIDDKAGRLGAALAYYTIFSVAPLLIVVVAVAGFAFGEEAVRGQIVGELAGLVGQQSAETIQTMIESARKPDEGLLATIVAIATILAGATGVFIQLQDALNTVWEVRRKPGAGILASIRDRFISFAMVFVVGFLLLVSLIVSATLSAIGKYLGGILPVPEIVLQVINIVLSFLIVMVLFAMIFKVLPDVLIAWRDVWVGAAVTALLFTIGKFLIGLYLGRSSVASTYGAAGSVVIFLLWVYYSAQIILYGAEFTQVYACRFGTRILPKASAYAVEKRRHRESARNEPDRPSATSAAASGGTIP